MPCLWHVCGGITMAIRQLNDYNLKSNVAGREFTLDHEFGPGSSKEGQLLIEVIDNDPDWVRWCMNNLSDWILHNDAYYYLINAQIPPNRIYCNICTEYCHFTYTEVNGKKLCVKCRMAENRKGGE